MANEVDPSSRATARDGPRPLDPLEGVSAPPVGIDGARVLGKVRERLFGRSGHPVRLDRYAIVGELGRGAHGVVYRAQDPKLGREVAIKLLRGSGRDASVDRQRLMREAQAIARLAHPNIVAIHDVGTYQSAEVTFDRVGLGSSPEPRVFIVMELVEGVSLDLWLHAAPRSVEEICTVFAAAGRGLMAAHEIGIVHRDFKPANVLVGDDGRIKVLDFGLARLDPNLGSELATIPDNVAEDGDLLLDGGMTLAGAAVGTPAYMAPEQHAGGRVGPPADQFCFCASLWEALHGTEAFVGATLEEIEQAKRSRGHRKRGQKRLPSRLRRVVERGLAPEAGERFPSMEPIVAELERRAAWTPWRIAGLVAMLVLVAGGALANSLLEDRARRACTDQERHVEGVWTEADADALARAFVDSGHPRAERLARQTSSVVDDYVDRWMEASRDSCLATLDEVQSTEIGELRDGCYQDRLRELDAVVDALGQVDAAGAEKGPIAARSLPRLEGCSEVAALQLAGQLDRGGAAREKLDELDAMVARANASAWATRHGEAIEIAERAVERARELGDEVTLARLGWRIGKSRLALGEFEAARERLMENLSLAERNHAEGTALNTMIALYRAHLGLERWQEAELLEEMARARLEDYPGGQFLRLELAFARGLGSYHRKDFERAQRELGEVFDLAARLDPPSREHLVHASNVRGAAFADLDRMSDAQVEWERALRVAEEYYGEDHPLVSRPTDNLAVLLHWRGSYEAAAHLHARALQLASGASDPDHDLLDNFRRNLAESLCAARHYDGSFEAFDDWMAEIRRREGADSTLVAWPLRRRAECRYHSGDEEGALEDARTALRLLEGSDESTSIGDAQLTVARVHLRRGAITEARTALDAALESMQALESGDFWVRRQQVLAGVLIAEGRGDEAVRVVQTIEAGMRKGDPIEEGEIRLLHARALYGRDPEAARAMVLSALDTLGRDDASEALRVAMRTWLASVPAE